VLDFRIDKLLSLPHKVIRFLVGFYQVRKTCLLAIFFALFFANPLQSQEADVQAGKKLFNSNCAACHKLNKKAVGPALREYLQNMTENGYTAG